ncbi:protein S100-A12-like [Athene noctua]|uniref:protein S100-A12-like n=1 Tax=Athene noctua TaxID=126797 RepID=UPI003EBCFA80
MLTQAVACSRCVTISDERGSQTSIKGLPRLSDHFNRPIRCKPSLEKRFLHYLKSSAMSARTHTATAHPETRQFPGNCTLEMALKTIVDVYHRYSIREGELDLLNFNDFKTLLTEQAPTFLQACGRYQPEYLKKLFKETDLNKDKELTFEEFTIVLAKVTDDAHRIIHKDDRCTPDKD